MATITATRIIIQSTGQTFTIPGNLTAAQAASSYPNLGLSSLQSGETIEGSTKVLTFSPRTGTKGATATRIIIQSTGQTFTVPGDLTAAQAAANYPNLGLSSLQASETLEGSTKVLTFSPRTGTKG